MRVLLISLLLFFQTDEDPQFRIIRYNGSDVKTTWKVDDRFYGKYEGSKSGFLELKKDGSGGYKYDVFGFAKPGCKKGVIEMEWGFLVDGDGDLVKFEREYGYSYPILLRSKSEDRSFKGCREQVMLDFIFDKSGVLGVSSSDDWEK